MICEERIGDRSGGYWGQPPDARRSKIIPPPVNKTLGRTVLFLALITLTLIHLAQAQVQDDSDLVFDDELVLDIPSTQRLVKRQVVAALDVDHNVKNYKRRQVRNSTQSTSQQHHKKLAINKDSIKKNKKRQNDLLVSKAKVVKNAVVDDEDMLSDSSGSGSLPTPAASAPVTSRQTYRCNVVLFQDFNPSLDNRDSAVFEELSNRFSDTVDQLYVSVPGQQSSTVLKFESVPFDVRRTKVDFDISSKEYFDEKVIESTLSQATKRGRLGSFLVDAKITCRSIEGSHQHPDCEIPCRTSNDCFNFGQRCDGNKDCADGTDEEQCGAPTLPTFDAPVDECRGDIKFTCRGGSKLICEVQLCDGTANCPEGDDEEGCPLPSSSTIAPRTTTSPITSPLPEPPTTLQPVTTTTTTEPPTTTERTTTTVPTTATVPEPTKPTTTTEHTTTEHITTTVSVPSTTSAAITTAASPSCGEDQFLCDMDRCIGQWQLCDGNVDCDDGTDENGCATGCSQNEFDCGSKCISLSMRCDRYADCPNGEDERQCAEPCQAGEFRCKDDTCVSISRRCDGRNDCSDGSDEAGCPCPKNKWQCDFGTCIDRRFRCDGKIDCPTDSSDETDCPCSDNQFRCGDGSCIDSRRKCDGYSDCRDRSDEANCTQPACHLNEYRCANGKCIPASLKCDKFSDCPGGDDETDCPEQVCSQYQFRCNDGVCIDSRRKCDTRRDCPDGSDEVNCDCRSNEYRCGTGQCISNSKRCDKVVDCPDRSDENDCGIQCQSGEFACASGNQCVPYSMVCDGRRDCQDFTDEAECPTKGEELNLKTYPNEQTILQGREVVFQCRDEGPLRAQVRWVRGSGLALPPQSIDQNGRLEMPNIQPEHTGTYVCEAVGYPSTAPGSRVSVYLKVDPFVEPTTRPSTACGVNEATCMNGECISKSSVCDGDFDCSDGSDEMRCSSLGCEPNEYQCENKRCILKTWRCDGDDDCGDNSDEKSCKPSPADSACRHDEFQCQSLNQCIPKSFHCDMELDCQDRSDEIGCSKPVILIPPPPMVMVNFGVTIVINCTAVGTPTPEVVWRLNWGHVPSKCSMTSENGFGVLTCPDARNIDQGAYSCEAINAKGSTFAVPDSIVVVKPAAEICIDEDFNSGATSPADCLPCFCFGITKECSSSSLHIAQLPPPTDQFQLITLNSDIIRRQPSLIASREVSASTATNRPYLRSTNANDGIQVYRRDSNQRETGFFNLPPSHRGNHLLSFGGYIKYRLVYRGSGTAIRAPDVIIRGNGVTLYHESRTRLEPNQANEVSVRFWPDEWMKPRGGDDSRDRATREDLMMVLQNIEFFLIRASYLDSAILDTTVSQIRMDTAFENPNSQTQAVLVEECRCPPGYTGLSCDTCAPGYVREEPISGRWLGRCIIAQQSHCNLMGTANQTGGNCHCKDLVTGQRCDQCKPNTFFLDSDNQDGCINCFCMGISKTCSSSNWYRRQEQSIFTSDTLGFKLTDKNQQEIVDSRITVNSVSREIEYREFNRHSQEVYYWKLPPKFVGNKLTSYGGFLNYTVRYAPAPGGRSSPNNAADVEIMGNNIRLLYHRRDPIEASRPNSVSVPIKEHYWQREDGRSVDREHLLMALADLDHILIKATYTTRTQEAALAEVTLDVADERNTGQSRAMAVEQCSCPRGYKGLSCEDCDSGYTRSIDGVYLGLCEPCKCNGHSNECDPDSGVCLNCRDHTTGDECELCATGYMGDPTAGTSNDCVPSGGEDLTCSCDTRGSVSGECRNGICDCKRNVEGHACSQCREGTFALMQQNSEGCLSCFCSGATRQCTSTNLYRTQIPMQIIDSQHGFILSERNGAAVNNLRIDVARNEISYHYPSNGGRSSRLYWSLPTIFIGDKVTSYGGQLSITQRFEERHSSGERFTESDVILIGNGLTLGFVNPNQIAVGQSVTYTVPLTESGWRRLDASAASSVSRNDMMRVLSNLQSILIRATYSTSMSSTVISNVIMDTAIAQNTGQERPREVEECRCPAGYRGTSCQQCETGYYLDRTAGLYGLCRRCPCNGNEESCVQQTDGRVVCNCRPGIGGRNCESEEVPVTPAPPNPPTPTIIMTITEPKIQIAEVGSTVRFHCSGQSLIGRQVLLKWSKEQSTLPVRAQDDRRGVLIITDVRSSDSGSYICSAFDGIDVVTETVVLNVAGEDPSPPQVTIEPRFLEVDIGQNVEVRCLAAGNPSPSIRWLTTHDVLIPTQGGVLKIASVRKSDEGEYTCVATNPSGSNSGSLTIMVRVGPAPQPDTGIQVVIAPQDVTARRGDNVRLTCRGEFADGHGNGNGNGNGNANHNGNGKGRRQFTIRWTKLDGTLPTNAAQSAGVLSIPNASPSDSGIYVCTITTVSGAVKISQGRVTVLAHRGPPTVRIEPDRQTVSQGSSADLRCLAVGDPTPSVRWTKVGEDFTSNVQVTGPLLRIVNAMVRDRGMYICTAENPGGIAQASAILEVERREPPAVELYPQSRQVVVQGGSALFQCRVTAGIPTPRAKWSRVDGRPLLPNVEELDGGVIRFNRVTGAEQGQYVCTAENDAGSITGVATLAVQSIPTITISPGSNPVRAKIGQRLRLECRAQGDPAPTVSWRRLRTGFLYDNIESKETQQIAVYDISRVTQTDEGTYSCTARNEAGLTEERVQVIVEASSGRGDIQENEIDIDNNNGGGNVQVEDVFRVPIGGTADMRCLITGSQLGIYLDWVRTDGGEMPADKDIRDGVLYIRNVQEDAAGVYSCIGLSASGSMLFSASTRLEVVAPPRIQLNPQRQVVRPGDSVYIMCSASGDQPITINWSKMNGTLPPAVLVNNGQLQFRGIAVSDAGRYICSARNSVGQAEAVAEVIVNEERVISGAQREQLVNIGSSVDLHCNIPATAGLTRVKWTRDRGVLPPTSFTSPTRSTLSLVNVQPSDAGRYICEVSSESGVSTDYVLLKVESKSINSRKRFIRLKRLPY